MEVQGNRLLLQECIHDEEPPSEKISSMKPFSLPAIIENLHSPALDWIKFELTLKSSKMKNFPVPLSKEFLDHRHCKCFFRYMSRQKQWSLLSSNLL